MTYDKSNLTELLKNAYTSICISTTCEGYKNIYVTKGCSNFKLLFTFIA